VVVLVNKIVWLSEFYLYGEMFKWIIQLYAHLLPFARKSWKRCNFPRPIPEEEYYFRCKEVGIV
jgi:molybdopterin/thiamine biosynthesis adenylyltransferase